LKDYENGYYFGFIRSEFFRNSFIDIKNNEIMEKELLVKEKRGFYIHFIIYIIVNIGIYVQWWYITDGVGFAWPITTTIGWGIGIIAHFIVVFVLLKK
jgi:hypothetical protein